MQGSLLLHYLNPNEPVALDKLAELSGLPTEQVEATCRWLIEIGVPLDWMPFNRLLLTRAVIPLKLNEIQQAVSKFDSDMAQTIEVFETIDSTNQYLMGLRRADLRHKQVCLAEFMTAGRGRQQKAWHSGAYQNVILSIAWEFHSELNQLSGLSLAIAVMVVKSLGNFCRAPFRLKWPNDVLVHERKLSGILVEMRDKTAIIGVGINCNLSSADKAVIDQPVVSLNDLTDSPVDRNKLMSLLLEELSVGLETFSVAGLEPFRADWKQLHAYQGRRMRSLVNPIQEGVAVDIDTSGALLITLDSGELASVNAGELEILQT